MTTITGPIPLNSPHIKLIDMSKMKFVKAEELPDDVYKNFIDGQKKMLELQYTQHADTSNHPAYKGYANIEVNGKVVAEIDNHGWVKSSNALGGKIRQAIEDADRLAGVKNGPQLAQARAEAIAELLGGKIIPLSTALSQSEFNTTPQPRPAVDYAAMQKDPRFAQLQKTEQARTEYMAQQIAQEDGSTSPSNEIKEPTSAEKFLELMQMTPEERYFELFLKREGLTQEEFDALPKDEQEKLMDKFKEEMKQQIEQETGVIS